MTIAFIGHGYVGLVTAAVFADLGNTVWVVGRTKEKIESLKKGIAPFYEPGLAELVKRNVDAGRLLFTLDFKEAVTPSSIVFTCVGTPPKKSGEADLTQVFAVSEQIAKHLTGYKVVVTKSTVPPGTNRKVADILKSHKNADSEFSIASVPEFLREGTAISDTLHPDRVVIGVEDDRAKDLLLELHKPISGKTVVTTIETAELIKYASNSLLSTKISFANSIAMVSEKVGADAEMVLEGVGLDRRLGRSFLYPGIGYGGSCFPKDVKALIAISSSVGYDFSLLKSVDRVNKEATEHFVKKVTDHFQGSLAGKTIAVLGLSFKPNTDDMREAPSISIISAFLSAGATVRAFDPIAMENAKRVLPESVIYESDAYTACKGADAVAVLTEWNEFRQLNLSKIVTLVKNPVLFDGRNIYDPTRVKQLGFVYYGVGRS